jgi:hypothetical protein
MQLCEGSSVSEIEEICRRLQLTNLKAQLALREIEHVGLNFEIDSLQTSPERKAEATARRDAALIEWGEIFTELEDLRNSSAIES